MIRGLRSRVSVWVITIGSMWFPYTLCAQHFQLADLVTYQLQSMTLWRTLKSLSYNSSGFCSTHTRSIRSRPSWQQTHSNHKNMLTRCPKLLKTWSWKLARCYQRIQRYQERQSTNGRSMHHSTLEWVRMPIWLRMSFISSCPKTWRSSWSLRTCAWSRSLLMISSLQSFVRDLIYSGQTKSLASKETIRWYAKSLAPWHTVHKQVKTKACYHRTPSAEAYTSCTMEQSISTTRTQSNLFHSNKDATSETSHIYSISRTNSSITSFPKKDKVTITSLDRHSLYLGWLMIRLKR